MTSFSKGAKDMRLGTSRPTAEEKLIAVINQGYRCLEIIELEYTNKTSLGLFDRTGDIPILQNEANKWGSAVRNVLVSVFPSELEWQFFKCEPARANVHIEGLDQHFVNLRETIKSHISRLHSILNDSLNRYTDLPLKERLFVEDIDSFQKVRDVNPGLVSRFLSNGYLDLPEDVVQLGLETILNVSFHKKDWGGEANDLYTANVVVNGLRRPTAFLLKGHGLKSNMMEIKNCGKNGDQVVRLFQNPADLFVIQFVGNISEAVIQHAHSETSRIRAVGKAANFLVIDGQDTARLLHAYGRLATEPAT